MYCSEVLVERVHAVLVSLKLFSHRQIKLPTDPIELSFWVATNFPFSNVDKLKLLEINNCIPRLHREIEVLKKVNNLNILKKCPMNIYFPKLER